MRLSEVRYVIRTLLNVIGQQQQQPRAGGRTMPQYSQFNKQDGRQAIFDSAAQYSNCWCLFSPLGKLARSIDEKNVPKKIKNVKKRKKNVTKIKNVCKR